MKILFDHQIYSLQNYGGISRYFTELIAGINELTHHRAELAVPLSDNVYLPDCTQLPGGQFRGRGTLTYQLNGLYDCYQIWRGGFDLFHATYYDPYFLKLFPQQPFVMTLHDMTHERLHRQFPELRPDRFYMGKHEMARRASRIIVVSDNTKRDVVDLLNIDPDRITVIPLASTLTPNLPANKQNVKQVEPYLLFVGNRGHYKNFITLLRAVTKLLPTHQLQLVCAGGGVFSPEEAVIIQSLGLDNWVNQQSFRTDEELTQLYAQARAFVFPSLYEGFGLPILEAFSCGCPCVLSQSSSLPEVAADAALFFDPAIPDSISQAIEKLIVNDDLRTDLIRKGKQQLENFSWQRTVSQTVAVYESILAELQ